jgi:hypothetical protein
VLEQHDRAVGAVVDALRDGVEVWLHWQTFSAGVVRRERVVDERSRDDEEICLRSVTGTRGWRGDYGQ